MGALIRKLDWSATGLGSIYDWPQRLKTTVAIVLRSPVPIVLLWGADGVMIYNDAYSAFAGGRHPRLLGSKVREGWPEVADFNDNVMKVGLSGGTLSYRDQQLTLYRKGIAEPVWMNLDYSPVLDESGKPAGVLAIVIETTERVLAQQAQSEAEKALRESEERRRIAAEAAQIGVWDYDLATNTLRWDERTRTLFGLKPNSLVDYETFLAGLHPDDREATHQAVQQALNPTGTGAYDIEYRTVGLEDGITRWIAAKGKCYFDSGRAQRFIGTVLDVSSAKEAHERQQLLAREANHRVKNIFANFHAMITLSAKSARTPLEMAEALRGRLDALMMAKDLVRPGMMGTEHENQRTTVDMLVRTVLKPYETGLPHRIVVTGPDVPVGAQAVTGLALALHETATNAVKYGALSKPDGSIKVKWKTDGHDLSLDWQEVGGPLIVSPPKTAGFGTSLTQRSVTHQLGGKINYNWRRSGLNLEITVPLHRLGV